jgi:hypothetical protein
MKTCGLDVHKDSIFCAVYDGKSYSEVKEYETTNPKIRQMGEYLHKEGVERIAMESTSTGAIQNVAFSDDDNRLEKSDLHNHRS